MSGDVTARPRAPVASADLAAAIRGTDFTSAAVTVLGYGAMGRQYVTALRALSVGRIQVCSRRPERMAELQGLEGVTTVAGGFERLTGPASPETLAIIATPTVRLGDATRALAALGFRHLLIEKPVSLRAGEIAQLAQAMAALGVDAWCAYNRIAYPSFHEVRARAAQEGGITSCTYTFTEFVHKIGPGGLFADDELARWGIANSLHVMSMAHGLIGLPARWRGYRTGAISWHPTGAVFVGAGVSESGVPFAYHADWGSTGRWSVEVHTHTASYRLCPLECAFRRSRPAGEWEELPVLAFAPEAKPGFVEEAAAALDARIRAMVPLVSLSHAAALTLFGEEVFGYGRTTGGGVG